MFVSVCFLLEGGRKGKEEVAVRFRVLVSGTMGELVTLGIPDVFMDTVGSWLMFERGRHRLPVMRSSMIEMWNSFVTDFSASKELMYLPLMNSLKTMYLTEDVGEGWRTGSCWALATVGDKLDMAAPAPIETLSTTRFAVFDWKGRTVCIQTMQGTDELVHFVKVEEVDGWQNRQILGTVNVLTGSVIDSYPRIMRKACPFCSVRESACECPPGLTQSFFRREFMARQIRYRRHPVRDLRAQILYNREWMNGTWHCRSDGSLQLCVVNEYTSDHFDRGFTNTLTRIFQHETQQLLKPSRGLLSMEDCFVEVQESTSSAKSSDGNLDYDPNSMYGGGAKRTTFRCSICNISIKRKYDVQRHIRSVHERRRDYQCPRCPLAFLRSSHLKDHMRGAHADTTENMCPICGRHFGMASKLKRHIASVHDNVRSFECQHCEKRYKDNKALKSHVLTKHSLKI